MCGILFQFLKHGVNKKNFENSLLLQKHRGPDHTGIKQINNHMIFGHVRLSTIDLLTRSNQPMINEETSNLIIFNGEIYNYVELRKRLQEKGLKFKTEGDTEVLLKSLEVNGINAIKYFNGAWSFLFYDVKKNKIIISRDRFGKNPLYFFKDNQNLIVSSEVKSIFHLLKKDRVIRKENIKTFINFNFLANDENTLYHNIRQLMPGEIGEIDLNNQNFFIKKHEFNKIENFLDKNNNLSLEEIIHDSVNVRLRSDVKTAVLVSGGLDGAIISSMVNKIGKKITYIKGDFGDDEDDYYSKYLAKNLNISIKKISMLPDKQDNILEKIEKVIQNFEFPIPLNGFTLASNILFEKISKLDIKVVLDGMGADEIYGGYFDRHSKPYINSCIEKNRFKDLILFLYYSTKYNQNNFLSLVKHTINKIGNYYINNDFFINKKSNPYFTKAEFYNLKKYQLFDNYFGHIPMTLRLYTNSAMMNSVEVRSPFYDYRQIFNISEDINFKFKNGLNKYGLRSILPDNLSKIKFRRNKQPFRYGFENFFINQKGDEISKSIKSSDLVNSLLNKNEINFYSKNFKSLKSIKLKHRFLRLYSVSVFEKIYGSNLL